MFFMFFFVFGITLFEICFTKSNALAVYLSRYLKQKYKAKKLDFFTVQASGRRLGTGYADVVGKKREQRHHK